MLSILDDREKKIIRHNFYGHYHSNDIRAQIIQLIYGQ